MKDIDLKNVLSESRSDMEENFSVYFLLIAVSEVVTKETDLWERLVVRRKKMSLGF